MDYQNSITFSPRRGSLQIRFNGKNFHACYSIVKELPDRKFNDNNGDKYWTVPVTKGAKAVKALAPYLTIADDVRQHYAALENNASTDADYREKAAQRFEALPAPYITQHSMTLFPHQQEVIAKIIRSGFHLLGDDMGLGKTLTASVCAYFMDLPVIVLSPIKAIRNWERTLEGVGVSEFAVYSHHHSKIPDVPDHDFILLADEAHAFKNSKANRTKAYLKLATHPHCKMAIPITGTAARNGRPAELWTHLNAIRHPLSKTFSKWEYERQYCGGGNWGYKGAWIANGATRLPELQAKLNGSFTRRLIDDCLDLPDKIRIVQQCEIDQDSITAYNRALAQLGVLTRVKYSDTEAMLMGVRRASSMAKIPTAIETAQDILDSGDKVVIMAYFQDTVKEIARILRVPYLIGGTPINDINQMVDDFQHGSLQAFVCTVLAGGEAIDLYAANKIILVDRPFTPGDTAQAEARLRRIGQTRPVVSVWLQAFPVDRAVDNELIRKQHQVRAIFNTNEDQLLASKIQHENVSATVLRALLGDEDIPETPMNINESSTQE